MTNTENVQLLRALFSALLRALRKYSQITQRTCQSAISLFNFFLSRNGVGARRTIACQRCPTVPYSWSEKFQHNLLHFLPCTKCGKVLANNDRFVDHLKQDHHIKGFTSVRYHGSSCKQLHPPTTKITNPIAITTKPTTTTTVADPQPVIRYYHMQ